jgi:hypothetical protein
MSHAAFSVLAFDASTGEFRGKVKRESDTASRGVQGEAPQPAKAASTVETPTAHLIRAADLGREGAIDITDLRADEAFALLFGAEE